MIEIYIYQMYLEDYIQTDKLFHAELSCTNRILFRSKVRKLHRLLEWMGCELYCVCVAGGPVV